MVRTGYGQCSCGICRMSRAVLYGVVIVERRCMQGMVRAGVKNCHIGCMLTHNICILRTVQGMTDLLLIIQYNEDN